MTESLVLLHGLWMRRPALWWLARRLRAAGFDVHLFAYASLWGAPERAAHRLAELLRGLGPGPVHVVGHSLGGVTALAALQRYRDLPPGRVVTLGSPLAGSRAARGLEQRGLRLLAGRSLPMLKQGVQIPPGREVGSIAGIHGQGAGQWVARFDGLHDGTVQVSETRLPGLADHLCLPLSHSGLMFSAAAAEAAVRFLRHGRFNPGD